MADGRGPDAGRAPPAAAAPGGASRGAAACRGAAPGPAPRAASGVDDVDVGASSAGGSGRLPWGIGRAWSSFIGFGALCRVRGRTSVPTKSGTGATPIRRFPARLSRPAPPARRYLRVMGPQRGSAVLERRETEAPIRVDTRAPGDARRGRRRAVTLLALTAVLPGTAQLAAGNRSLGRFALRVWLGLLVGRRRSSGCSPWSAAPPPSPWSRTAGPCSSCRWCCSGSRCCGPCCSSTPGGSGSPTGCPGVTAAALLVAAARPAARAAGRRGLRRHQRRGRPGAR